MTYSYCGHAGPVVKVMASGNKRYLVSIGSTDNTILLWKHETELVDDSGSDTDNDNIHMTTGEGGKSTTVKNNDRRLLPSYSTMDLHTNADATNEIPSVSQRSKLKLAYARGDTHDEIVKIVKDKYEAKGDPVPDHASWQQCVMAPSDDSTDGTFEFEKAGNVGGTGTTDVDFSLKWVYGYRAHDTRNNLRYSSKGKIIYCGASLAIGKSLKSLWSL